jgi:hypothetical protein
MNRERVFESREQVCPLFTQGREITANATKDGLLIIETIQKRVLVMLLSPLY